MTHYMLKSTKGLGDFVVLSALQKTLEEQGHKVSAIGPRPALCLWDYFQNVGFLVDNEVQLTAQDYKLADISHYLEKFPHSSNFPGTQSKAHFVKWMGYEFSKQTGIGIDVSPADVRIVLTDNEIEYGRKKMAEISKENGNRPNIIIAPQTNSPNKDIPTDITKSLTREIGKFATPLLLLPYKEDDLGIHQIGDANLRNVSALLLASDAFVGADSAPWHISAGAIQGATDKKAKYELDDLGKMFGLAGSSAWETMHYASEGNGASNVIQGTTVCEVAPCGNHGYGNANYEQHFRETKSKDVHFFPNNCIYFSYMEFDCMKNFNTVDIAEQIREHIRSKRK